MKIDLRAVLALHFCVLCWGFTAILGRLISLSAGPLVWWRVFLTTAAIALFLPKKSLSAISRPDRWRLAGIGAVVGLHWLCFYGAIKLANASVAVASVASTSLFTAFLEPFLLKKQTNWTDVGFGLAILPGMALIAKNLDASQLDGFAAGIAAALLAALFSILNKKMVDRVEPLAMTLIEMAAIAVALGAVLPLIFWAQPELSFWPKRADWLWLALLALACTALPFALSLFALRQMSAFSANLIINLEPVYGVVLAALLLHEDKDLTTGFYIGSALVLATVFGHPFFMKKARAPKK